MKIKTNSTVVDAALKRSLGHLTTLLRQKGRKKVMEEHKETEELILDLSKITSKMKKTFVFFKEENHPRIRE